MIVQLNTDHNIKGSEGFAEKLEASLKTDLERFVDQISRIEVHLTDSNGKKSGPADKRCLLEARLNGMEPMSVSDEAGTVDEAFAGASQKLAHLLDHHFGKLRRHHQ